MQNRSFFRLFERFFMMLSITGLFLAFMLSCGQAGQKPGEGATEDVYVFGPPEWTKNAVIYEANIRQYTPEGTFKAFEAHLPRLQELGVDILWLMPIHPIGEKNRKGSLGSYYAVKDYKEVNPEFGTLGEFKALVKKAHEMGFYVILDWVANHTAWDNPWITAHPDWYTQDSAGNIIYPSDWTDVADLNYDNQDMRAAMLDALKYWVAETDIDGYRCDVAADVPTDFWDEARRELDRIKPVFMLAEAEKPEHHENAFDMSYAWHLHHIFNEIARGEQNADSLESYFAEYDTLFPQSAYRMIFITNHDENSWNGTVKERMGEAGNTFAVLSYTLPGMPLIYSGQETGLDKRLLFFEKDAIVWDYESSLFGFYSSLNRLKKNNKALWNGTYGGMMTRVATTNAENVFAFTRSREDNVLLIVTNLSGNPLQAGVLDEGLEGEYTDTFSDETLILDSKPVFDLGPWEYRVLIKKDQGAQ